MRARWDLERIYADHIEWARSLAYLLTRDPHLAEDIAQEAFVRVAGRLHHLRRADAFKAYLRRTLINLCRAHFRRLAVERRIPGASPRVDEIGWDPDPQGSDELTRALSALPPRQRMAVVLRYYEDLPEERVADAMRCSRRAVNALVSRAMRTLRHELGRAEA